MSELIDIQVSNPPPSDFLPDSYWIYRHFLWNRGFRDISNSDEFTSINDPEYSPLSMKDVHKAAQRCLEYIDNKDPILIYGDYDADGVCSTVLMYEALGELGANVSWYVPNRMKDGYGININSLKKVIDNYLPDCKVVITVDNGINSADVVTFAGRNNIDMIITDHHESQPDKYPHSAVAVINPKQEGCQYPNRNLAGVGVVYVFVSELYRLADRQYEVEKWLDLVAIGTVADMMPLDNPQNRYYVRHGLDILNNRVRKNIASLFSLSGNNGTIDEGTIGFVIAPCINAAGRLDDATKAVLSFVDVDNQEFYARGLHKINDVRKKKQAQAMKEIIDKDYLFKDNRVIVIKSGQLTSGLSGLIAGRLKDMYGYPAIIMSPKGSDASIYFGSVRSTDGIDVEQLFAPIKDIFISYGGHAKAAGFQIKSENIKQMESYFYDTYIERELASMKDVIVDMEQDNLGFISEGLWNNLRKLSPFSNHSMPKPSFLTRDINIVPGSISLMGGIGEHIKFRVVDHMGNSFSVTGFGMGNIRDILTPSIDLAYTIEKQTFGGKSGIELFATGVVPSATHRPHIEEVLRAKQSLGASQRRRV